MGPELRLRSDDRCRSGFISHGRFDHVTAKRDKSSLECAHSCWMRPCVVDGGRGSHAARLSDRLATVWPYFRRMAGEIPSMVDVAAPGWASATRHRRV